MNEVNNINEYFVLGDAGGIRKTQRRIEKSNMDLTEKAFLVEECRKALTDISQIEN